MDTPPPMPREWGQYTPAADADVCTDPAMELAFLVKRMRRNLPDHQVSTLLTAAAVKVMAPRGRLQRALDEHANSQREAEQPYDRRRAAWNAWPGHRT